MGHDEVAPCRRCGEEISVEVDRCPACGYEPGRSMTVNVMALLCLPALFLSTVFASGLVYLLAVGAVAVFPSALGVVVFAAIAVAAGRVLLRWFRQGKRSPTSDPLDWLE